MDITKVVESMLDAQRDIIIKANEPTNEPEWEYTWPNHIGTRYEAAAGCPCVDCFGDFSEGSR
jgi:hypothetical protein